MQRFLVVAAVLAMTALPGLQNPLEAQVNRARVPRSLLVVAHNDLTFGTVFPGVSAAVGVHDPRRAALFEIEGPADAAVRVELLLPSVLTTTGGAELPIGFGPGDGFADFSRGWPPRGSVFNPHGPLISTLGPNGRLYVRLGGRVQPALPQVGGAYRGTIYLTVYDIGS
jgi:hypothetical protein